MNNDYIFNATKQLNIPSESKHLFNLIKDGLARIKSADSNIDEVVVVGGTVIDLLLGLNPKDIDIRYSYKVNGITSNKCHCEHIRRIAEKEFDKEVLEHGLEFENVNEHEPRLSFKENVLGFFTYPIDYICLFLIEPNGNIWTNRDAFKCFQDKTFEIRLEGWLIWLEFRDINNYYRIFSDSMTRGLSYVYKRKLKIGQKFGLALNYFPFVLSKLSSYPEESIKYSKLFKSKIGDLDKLSLILEQNNILNREEIVKAMLQVLNKKVDSNVKIQIPGKF